MLIFVLKQISMNPLVHIFVCTIFCQHFKWNFRLRLQLLPQIKSEGWNSSTWDTSDYNKPSEVGCEALSFSLCSNFLLRNSANWSVILSIRTTFELCLRARNLTCWSNPEPWLETKAQSDRCHARKNDIISELNIAKNPGTLIIQKSPERPRSCPQGQAQFPKWHS